MYFKEVKIQEMSEIPEKKKNFSLKSIAARIQVGKPNLEKGGLYSYKKEDFIVQFHRRISYPIVNAVNPISQITPNRITWFGFFLSGISAIFLAFAKGNLLWLFTASVFYWISGIMDCVDGQLARIRKSSGRHGEFLDSVLEVGKGMLFWFAVGINITQHSSQIWGIDVWFLVAVCLSMLGWLSIGSIYSSWLFQESQPVSHGHMYIGILIMMSNFLELALLTFAVLSTLGMVYTLFEKTFLFALENED